jgi:PTH1 family peptidyl-tRNA hydrolase
VGFRLVDRLAGGDAWTSKPEGEFLKKGELVLGRPLTYMNESGRFVGALARFFKIEPADVLVCYDEIALPLGRIRLRPSGSAGGQNGMKSVIAHLGTDKVPRLRIGIGPQPEGMSSEAYVLKKFSKEQEEKLPDVLDRAASAVDVFLTEGIEAAMNRFNSDDSAA